LADRNAKLQRRVAKRRLTTMQRHVLVCVDDDCDRKLVKRFRRAIDAAGLRATVAMTKVQCFGICTSGPIVVVYPEGTWYARVTPDVAERIVDQHLRDGEPVASHVFLRNPLCPVVTIAETA
jgi:(2Fe-2S) ferredoxin